MLAFDYCILNVYQPELDGPGPELHAKWAEQVCLADPLGYDTTWFTEHHFRHFGGMLSISSGAAALARLQ